MDAIVRFLRVQRHISCRRCQRGTPSEGATGGVGARGTESVFDVSAKKITYNLGADGTCELISHVSRRMKKHAFRDAGEQHLKSRRTRA